MLRDWQRKLSERPFYLWLILWLGVSLLYLPAWKGGFQQDFQGWLELYYDHSFWEMLNRSTAGIHSFYQVTQLQLYAWTWLFGLHPVPWFLLFTALHALNGVQLFRLCRSVLNDFGFHSAELAASGSVLLVLFNPSMTEVVLWKACYHYLIALQAILWMLMWMRACLLSGAVKWIWRSLILFVALLFTLELWYIIPALSAVMAFAYWRAGLISGPRLRSSFLRLILPLLSFFGVYLLAYKICYHTWIAHGVQIHVEHTPLLRVLAHAWTYEWHLLGFGRFFSHPTRQWFYDLTGNTFAGGIFLILIAGFAAWAVLRYPRWGAGARAATLFTAWALISLAIILPYPPPDLFRVCNDRALYCTAFFQWPLVALLLASLFRKRPRLRNAVFAALLLLCVGFTAQLIWDWRQGTKVFWAIQNKFLWKDAPVVLILNMPSTYNGVGIIRGADSSELPAHIHIYRRDTVKGRVYDVSSYNMQHAYDGAHVIVEDSTHLHIVLNQWGSWWQLKGLGALDRSNEIFDLHFIDGGHDYRLTLKHRPPGMVILYQQGREWRVVDMNKIGQEQW